MVQQSEGVFRALLCVLFAALAGLWGWAFLRAGIDRAAFLGRHEGLAVAITIRVLLSASILAMAAYAVHPETMQWAQAPLPDALRYFGALLCGLALWLFESARRNLGRAFNPSLRVNPKALLVTSGPYRLIRHPMYVAFLATWTGYGLLSANWFIGTTGAAAECAIALIRTRREEAMLMAAFGPEYARYARRTGKFLPRLKQGRRTA
jgi:protein-S-isoprenylcysteine O-methyltransferase Ste14